jgi:hypothetical protein
MDVVFWAMILNLDWIMKFRNSGRREATCGFLGVGRYQPGIDLEGLRTANIAECDVRVVGFSGDACVLGTQAGPSQTQWEEVVQLVLDSWHELQ